MTQVNKKTKTKIPLKIDTNYFFSSRVRPTHVVVVGCGGTGSYFIPNIARLLYSINTDTVNLTLIDADKVEEKNLIRQNFSPGDIGKNKAEALAVRYSGAFGLNIAFQESFLESKKDICRLFNSKKGPLLVVSCVDNIRTRLAIREAIHEQQFDYKDIYWIDTGNEDEAGQVVFAAKPSIEDKAINLYPTKTGVSFNIPDIFDLYPELITRAKNSKFTSELSCTELAESSPQFGFINNNAANFALNFAFDIMTGGPIKVHAVEFSIKNKVSHRPLNRTNMLTWESKLFDINQKVDKYLQTQL